MDYPQAGPVGCCCLAAGRACFQCYFSYTTRKGDWKALHDRKAWRDLAVSVMNVGYQNDLTYFLLGEAAVGLGLKDVAKVYCERAVGAQRAGNGCGESCEGFELKMLADTASR